MCLQTGLIYQGQHVIVSQKDILSQLMAVNYYWSLYDSIAGKTELRNWPSSNIPISLMALSDLARQTAIEDVRLGVSKMKDGSAGVGSGAGAGIEDRHISYAEFIRQTFVSTGYTNKTLDELSDEIGFDTDSPKAYEIIVAYDNYASCGLPTLIMSTQLTLPTT